MSDHWSLWMSSQAGPRRPRPFRFENYWIKIPGFHEEVKRAWCKPIEFSQPILALHNKMAIVARHLRAWSRSIISDAKLKLHMALEVIQQLETAQESRELSSAERLLRTRLKKHVMALAIIERARKRKASLESRTSGYGTPTQISSAPRRTEGRILSNACTSREVGQCHMRIKLTLLNLIFALCWGYLK